MKIDCHLHLVGAGPRSGGYVSRGMRRSISFKYLTRKLGLHRLADPDAQDQEYVRILADHLASSEIDRGVLLAFDEIYDRSGEARRDLTFLYVANDYVRDTCAAFPQVFLYGASVHPYRRDALEELERVRGDGAVLVKLLPNSQGFDPSDVGLLPYYKKAAQVGLPLLFHAGFEHTIPAMDQKLGEPMLLRRALDEGVTVILAHGGTSGLFHRRETFGDSLRLLAEYENCFADTSAMCNLWRSRYLFELLRPERLEKKYGVFLPDPSAKLIHGSDYPIPITPVAFVGRTRVGDRRAAKRNRNPIALDVDLKRLAGLPDACLTRGADVLNLSL